MCRHQNLTDKCFYADITCRQIHASMLTSCPHWQQMLKIDTCIYADSKRQHIDITCRHHRRRQRLTDDSPATKDAPSSASLAWCWTVSMFRQVPPDCRRSTTRLRYETVAAAYALLSPTHSQIHKFKGIFNKEVVTHNYIILAFIQPDCTAVFTGQRHLQWILDIWCHYMPCHYT